ncbi:MAG: DivIVA domain-containing protein [Candidatus Atribacteria bacterium]|nr:DivIVA domain-containing protein [Candidatus Atribacteria bacterium]
MDWKPEDIVEVDFNRSFRGYNEAEVREFLEELASHWEALLEEKEKVIQENRELKKKLSEKEEYLKRIDAQMEEWRKQLEVEKGLAKKEAAMIVEEAEMKARKIVEDALARKKTIEAGYNELLEKYRLFQIRFKSLLQTFMESIEWKGKEWEVIEENKKEGTKNEAEEDGGEIARFSLKDFKDEGRMRRS